MDKKDPQHSILYIMLFLSSIAIIAADFSSGKMVNVWYGVFFAIIVADYICLQIFRKRMPSDPFVKYHKVLKLLCVIGFVMDILVKCLFLIVEPKFRSSIMIGVICLFALSFIGIFIFYKLVDKDSEQQKQIELVTQKNQRLQQAISNNYSLLGNFLTTASATENNPKLFKENFDHFFNITDKKEGAIFGDLLNVVNENYYGIIDYLKANYPTLIYEELALCALICLGFSASSIGVVFGNTKASSIYNRRYRLRKKLQTPADIQVETFIYQIVEELKESAK